MTTLEMIRELHQGKSALELSIEKWEHIVELCNQQKFYEAVEAEEGPENCALCYEYLVYGCRGCPVCEKTGMAHCLDSPYEEWDNACDYGNNANIMIAAEEELAFLKSLWQ